MKMVLQPQLTSVVKSQFTTSSLSLFITLDKIKKAEVACWDSSYGRPVHTAYCGHVLLFNFRFVMATQYDLSQYVWQLGAKYFDTGSTSFTSLTTVAHISI